MKRIKKWFSNLIYKAKFKYICHKPRTFKCDESLFSNCGEPTDTEKSLFPKGNGNPLHSPFKFRKEDHIIVTHINS